MCQDRQPLCWNFKIYFALELQDGPQRIHDACLRYTATAFEIYFGAGGHGYHSLNDYAHEAILSAFFIDIQPGPEYWIP